MDDRKYIHIFMCTLLHLNCIEREREHFIFPFTILVLSVVQWMVFMTIYTMILMMLMMRWHVCMYMYMNMRRTHVFFSCEIVSFTIIITGKSEKKKQAKILPLLLSEWEKKIVKRVHMDSRGGDIACFHHEHHHITENSSSSIQAAIHPFRQDISTHNSKNASASANNLLHSKKFFSPRRRRKKHPSLSS